MQQVEEELSTHTHTNLDIASFLLAIAGFRAAFPNEGNGFL